MTGDNIKFLIESPSEKVIDDIDVGQMLLISNSIWCGQITMTHRDTRKEEKRFAIVLELRDNSNYLIVMPIEMNKKTFTDYTRPLREMVSLIVEKVLPNLIKPHAKTKKEESMSNIEPIIYH